MAVRCERQPIVLHIPIATQYILNYLVLTMDYGPSTMDFALSSLRQQ